MFDLRDLIGVPFADGGRDPKRGMDCWGMFVETQRRFGHDVPDYKVSAFDSEGIGREYEKNIGSWKPVENPEPGDAVALSLDPENAGTIQHFGTYIGGGRFLHSLDKVGSVVSRVQHPYWSKKIRGYYRWSR